MSPVFARFSGLSPPCSLVAYPVGYAKLLGLVVQHWLLIQGCWDDPHHSLTQAAAVVRDHCAGVREALAGRFSLERTIRRLVKALQTGCSIPARASRPSTSRLLEGTSFWGLT